MVVVVGVFVIAAATVWIVGSWLTRLIDRIAIQTGMGHALAGMLLLAGITSLPEIATIGTAAAMGSPRLALANLLGRSAINVLLLAIFDSLIGKGPVTGFIAKPSLLLQGVMSMLILVLAAFAMSAGDVQVFGVGLWSIAIAVAAFGAFKLAARGENEPAWKVIDERIGHKKDRSKPDAADKKSLPRLWTLTVGSGAVIFVSGAALSWSGDAIADRSGLGESFVGFLLVGFSTSLTEVTAVVTAYRLGRYSLAVGDIFGTNIFNTALLLMADALNREGPILNLAGGFEIAAALLGALLTGLVVVGLIERRDRTFLRMGWDSIAVIATFIAGTLLLYPLSQ